MSEADPDNNYYNECSKQCNYYSIDSFGVESKGINHSQNNISLLHANIRSVKHNFNNLETYLQSLSFEFDVIGLSETWLNDTEVDNFNHAGYVAENACRTHKTGGGVSLLLKNSLHYRKRIDLSVMNANIECLFVEISRSDNVKNSNKHSKVLVGVIYRPPNTPIDDFIDDLSNILHVIKQESKLCYLMGDININLLNTDTHPRTAHFLETMYSYSFTPLITKPTRVTTYIQIRL